MKDAFQLLLRQRKGHGGTSRQHDSQEQMKRKREYDLCPICLRSIPTSFLDIHAKTCLDSCQQQRQQQDPSPPSDALLTPGTHTSTPEPATQQSLTQASVPKERAAEGGGGSLEGTPSALHVMMQAQRRVAQQQQPQNHVFYLEWDDCNLQGPASEQIGNDDLSQRPSSSACENAQLKSGTWRCYWWMERPSKKHNQASQGPPTTSDSSQPSPHSSQQVAHHHQVPSPALPGSRPRSVPCWSATIVVKEKGRRASGAAAASSPSKSDSSTSKGGGPAAAGAPCHLLLQTNVPPCQGGSVTWQNTGMRSNVHVPAEGVWRGHPSALKSALQKAVRRGMAPAACRLCLQMLKDDPAELLRRLPIICLEDTTAHPTLLPVVVWLMCAQSKGYALGALHAAAVLDMTYQLACVGVRDHLPTHPPTLNPGPSLPSFSAVDDFLSGEDVHHESVLVKAMLLRAHYGGMAGDVESCKGYAALWCARFAASSNLCHSPPAAEDRHPLFCNVANPPASPAPSSAQPAPGAASMPPREPSAPPPQPASPLLTSPLQGTSQQQVSAHHHCGHKDASQQEGCQSVAQGTSQQQGSALHHFGHEDAPQQEVCQGPQQGASQQQGSAHHHYGHKDTPQQKGYQGPLQGAPQQLGSEHHHFGCKDVSQQEGCQGVPQEACQGSAWFAYLCSLYGGLRTAPMELSCVARVGALRRSDVPLAAIDFHVSDIVEHLLEVPHVAEAANSICCASWGIEGDTVAQMRNAMWLFRSSVNHRAWLPLRRTSLTGSSPGSKHDATGNQVDMDLVAYEHQPLIADLEQEAAQKDRLLPMWQVAEPVANQFAASLIAKRFQSSFQSNRQTKA
ncbi:hypothetical protein DUNSADRAFT_3597 [Dunaliella salina]|uniref:UBZ4-type domain-containing protein n=1 Tax=Dunaliella salina TaxID=3046 RepID=A0ABQ7GTR7_DUNSA|nr:hypothetical protein DUNSADRAFT_3597 [Dunaliella salina]|eukprot:KAF5838004.1 hypothetical protein DUNSADRAFT_3597 [Dunaliella salina]